MKLLRLSSEGKHEEISQLLRSEEKGAAVNATFVEILVRHMQLLHTKASA